MKQSIKRIFKALLAISLLLLISGFVITYFFSEKIEKTVINKIQDEMTSDLKLKDVAFSLYENFPSASVKINNLLAFEKKDSIMTLSFMQNLLILKSVSLILY